MITMSTRKAATTVIILLWLGSMAWLIFREAYPGLLDQTSPGYRTFFSHGILIMDRWMKLSFQGKSIGYSHTSVDVDDKNPLRQYRMLNRTVLSMNVMGSRQRIAVNADAELDAQYDLQSFTFSLSSSGYSINVDGQRRKGNTFDVKVRSASSVQQLTVTIPSDAVLYSPMTEMSLKTLTPGHKVTLRIFNPVTLTSQNITVRALRRETLMHRKESIPTTVLTALVDGMETLSWIDADGTVIRQLTPFGWEMESCTAEEALAFKSRGGDEDMLSGLAVPIQGNTDLLSSQSSARLLLRGTTLTREQLETHRQEIVSLGTNSAEIIVKSDTLAAAGCAPDAIPPDLKPWLASTAFIQATDPRMIRKAREITGHWTNSLDAAMAIYRWVNANVTKKPTVSLPSALDVLQKPEGDCNEHTYLFVGLARAAGLPAMIRVGVTLHEGQFYYHAWPSVYVGRWLDMDPTLGLPAVNAGYISLVEGELAEQMKLMGVIGQLKVKIIEDSRHKAGSTGPSVKGRAGFTPATSDLAKPKKENDT